MSHIHRPSKAAVRIIVTVGCVMALVLHFLGMHTGSAAAGVATNLAWLWGME